MENKFNIDKFISEVWGTNKYNDFDSDFIQHDRDEYEFIDFDDDDNFLEIKDLVKEVPKKT